jgi:nucleotide-binding universal stress UspA family protein
LILFAYDGSDDARRALSAGAELGSRRALVVHVWEPVPPGAATAVATPGAVGAALPKLAEAERDIERRARDLLKEGVQLAEAAGFDAEPVLIQGSGGSVWQRLLEIADERDVDVIVVGRRGVSRLRGVLLGSVSNAVIQHAHVPVLVVPRP